MANDVEVWNYDIYTILSLLLPAGEVVLDSLPVAAANDATQLPCSPASLFNSDVTCKTLESLEVAETAAFTAAAPNDSQPQAGACGHPQKVYSKIQAQPLIKAHPNSMYIRIVCMSFSYEVETGTWLEGSDKDASPTSSNCFFLHRKLVYFDGFLQSVNVQPQLLLLNPS